MINQKRFVGTTSPKSAAGRLKSKNKGLMFAEGRQNRGLRRCHAHTAHAMRIFDITDNLTGTIAHIDGDQTSTVRQKLQQTVRLGFDAPFDNNHVIRAMFVAIA